MPKIMPRLLPEHREKAQEEQLVMYSVAIDWRYCRAKAHHIKESRYDGVLTAEQATRLNNFINALIEEHRQ